MPVGSPTACLRGRCWRPSSLAPCLGRELVAGGRVVTRPRSRPCSTASLRGSLAASSTRARFPSTTHSTAFWGPLAFGILALAAGLADGYLVGALPWALHVAFDRTIGLRLRSPDGFQRPEGSGPSRPWSLLSSSAYASRQRGGACLS